MRKFILLILMLLILTPLSLKADEKIKIVATIPPLASIAREIAGDRAEVYYIIPTNSDPHQYSLSPRDVSLAESSDLFISVGTEPFIKKLNVRRALSWDDWIKAGIVVKDDNPHYLWLYPENAVKIAETIERKLEEIDPLGEGLLQGESGEVQGEHKGAHVMDIQLHLQHKGKLCASSRIPFLSYCRCYGAKGGRHTDKG
jgi:ABC-type Zn uptake system ZnuABC Zn-binding protein ZnuA